LKPGTFNGVAHISDWMPTFCILAGYTAESDVKWDGQNIMPQLRGDEPPKPRTLYTAAPGYRAVTLRDGDWKLIVKKDSKGDPGKSELYDLNQDPYESTNLATSMPELVAMLQQKLTEAAGADKDAVAND
jgi:arylsulfatase A-like enzyme